MPEPQNEEICEKQFNRRFKTGCLALALITVSYYCALFKPASLDWFVEYAKFVVFISGAVILGITTTDAITNWKRSDK